MAPRPKKPNKAKKVQPKKQTVSAPNLPAKTPSPGKKRKSDVNTGPPDKKLHRLSTVQVLEAPLKSPLDHNEYRLIRLTNGIRALLISDLRPSKLPTWHHGPNNYSCHSDHEHIPFTRSLFASEAERFRNPRSGTLRPIHETRRTEFQDLSIVENSSNTCKSYHKLKDHIFLGSDVDSKGDLNPKPPLDHGSWSTTFAMTVNVGSTNDPQDYLGLAHFCEHMVHYESVAFPKEGVYDNHISDQGYRANAYTDCMTTTYHFTVTENSLEKTLDMFSNMIAYPQFQKDNVGREVHSVDDEFTLGKHEDLCQVYHILMSLANKEHPLNSFDYGNLETLLHPKDPNGLSALQKELKAFHKEYYVGTAMTIALQSSLSLDKMEKLVVDHFSKISEGGRCIASSTPVDDVLKAPYDNTGFNKLYFIKGKQFHRRLSLIWALPAEAWKDWHNKPLELLSILIKDESSCGLPAYLRKQSWIIDLDADCSQCELNRNEYASLFEIHLRLTSKGLGNFSKILEAIFSYFKTIEKTPLTQKVRLWKELSQSSTKYFDYSGPGEQGSLTVQASRNLQILPGQNIFTSKAWSKEDFDDQVFTKYFKMFTPRRMNVMMVILPHDPFISQIKFDCRERYTGTEYRVSKFDLNLIKTLEGMKPFADFSFIPSNPFVGSCRVADVGGIIPQKIAINEKLTVFHHGHVVNTVFKSRCRVDFISGIVKPNSRNAWYLEILGGCLRKILASEVSAVQRSGMKVHLGDTAIGVVVVLCGLPEMMLPILTSIVTKVISRKSLISQETFELVKDSMMDDFTSSLGDNYSVSANIDYELSIVRSPSTEDRLSVLQSIRFKGFMSFIELFKSSSRAEVNLSGNISLEAGRTMAEIMDNLDYAPRLGNLALLGDDNMINFPTQERCLRVRSTVPGDGNTHVKNYYQLAHLRNTKVTAIARFLAIYMRPRVFHVLRTQKQLGYHISLYLETFSSVMLVVRVIAPAHKHTACKVDQEIDQFLVSFYHKYLKLISQAEFSNFKSSRLDMFPNLELKDVVTWYEGNVLPAIRIHEESGRVEWQRTGRIGKLSIQVLGCDGENCKDVERCRNSSWAKPVSDDQKVLFVQDGPCDTPYFIPNIKEFRDPRAKAKVSTMFHCV